MGFTNVKTFAGFTRDAVDYHGSVALALVDALSLSFVGVLTVVFLGGSNLIKDSIHDLHFDVREDHLF